MSDSHKKLDEKCINTLRFLSVDAVQKANSGHPGMPMGCAPIAFTLYSKFMKHNPANPKWLNRDRFVLSAGHGSMLLYSSLHLCGYDISLDDLKNFRQWESITPGHPEYGLTPGVETTTGPLGQGITNAVGMSLASNHLAAMFNKENFPILDHYIYVIASDGDMMEGVSHEAASFAGHNKLGNLIVFYDNNKITIDGELSLAMSEDVAGRYEAYGWHIQHINDVNDLDAIEKAVVNAQKEKTRPSMIVTNTHIGYGSPNKQDTAGVHGSPLGDDEIKLTKKKLGWPEDKSFYVPDEVNEYFSKVKTEGKKAEDEWKLLFEKYAVEFPEDAKLFKDIFDGNFGEDWKKELPKFENWNEKMATRGASGKVLGSIMAPLPTLFGGSADLTPSNNTSVDGYNNFSSQNFAGRYVHYGIREHAMASIMNGMAIYGGVIPYGGTFLIFSDYLRPALRLAALSGVKPIFVFTHDSIGLGEDGPTHQPIEHLSSLRAIPGLVLIRPADANDTVYAWQAAIEHKGSPVAFALTRQKLPVLDRTKYTSAEGVLKGAYVIKDTDERPDLILLSTGSEVSLCLEAAEELDNEGIKTRVVNMASWELFENQDEKYKEEVIPSDVKARLSVEAAVEHGWKKYTGDLGDSLSIERYGSSAPYQDIYNNFGFTVDNIKAKAKEVIKKAK